MALSNIFREPRREITEQLVGVIPFGVVLIPIYYAGSWIQAHDTDSKGPLIVYMVIAGSGIALGFLILWFLLLLTHAVGESICNWMAKRGLEIRPKDRKS